MTPLISNPYKLNTGNNMAPHTTKSVVHGQVGTSSDISDSGLPAPLSHDCCSSPVLHPTLAEKALAVGLEIRPLLGQSFGAEVLKMDLVNKPMAPIVNVVRKALLAHKVLVFRDQDDLTPEKHVEFSRYFGTLYQHALDEARLPGAEDIVVVSNEVDEAGKKKGINGIEESQSRNGRRHYWHSDLSYMAAPPMGSMLHIKVLPADGSGDTLFADMVQAYEGLPSEKQSELLSLQALHLFHKNLSKEAYSAMDASARAVLENLPAMSHPVVRTHPETDRKSLFVSEGFTTGIEGMEEAEGQALLDWLFDYTSQEKFVYRHKWKKGDMVFWDNRMLLHFATGSELPRTLYRTTIKGDVVF